MSRAGRATYLVIIRYSWIIAMCLVGGALLALNTGNKIVGTILFYLPLPMLVLGLLAGLQMSGIVKYLLVILSSAGLCVGIGFAAIVLNSGGAQGGVGVYLASILISYFYIAAVLVIFTVQMLYRMYAKFRSPQ